MLIENLKPHSLNWTQIPAEKIVGETGSALAKIRLAGNIKIRMVEYSKDYLADHWCRKGHIVHCLDGGFVTELESGENFVLTKGMSYIVSDELSSHRSMTENGVKLLIVDGDFLKST